MGKYDIFIIVNISALENVSNLFDSISPSPRLQILLAIGAGDPCVCHLKANFGWRQSYLSQHLMALRKTGILIASRQGRNIHYRLNDPRMLDLINDAAKILGVEIPKITLSQTCSCPKCKQEKK